MVCLVVVGVFRGLGWVYGCFDVCVLYMIGICLLLLVLVW